MMTQDSNANCSTQTTAELEWFETSIGHYVQDKEQVLYDQAVFDLFGFKALQMGATQLALLRNSRIPNRFVAASHQASNGQIYCEDDFLPFPEMSLDLLLLPHRLEFSPRPHQTLREATRVLMPEGHLIITGFNPMSIWGIKSLVKKVVHYLRFKKYDEFPIEMYPWNANMIRLSRLKDWLALLGFEVVQLEKVCHMPPFSNEKLQRRFLWLDHLCKSSVGAFGCHRFGGVYFIVAKKRQPGLTPLKPQWKVPKLPHGLIVRPTAPKTKQHQKQTNHEQSEKTVNGQSRN
jgi:SAM-dependent methyltransferase